MNGVIEANVDPNGKQTVERLIKEGVCGSAVYLQQASSTNTLALDFLSHVEPAGLDRHLPRLFLTDHQTAGRGRLGRTWSSSTDSLTFSLLIASNSGGRDASLPVSIRAGVHTAEAIDAFLAPLQSEIKWPNDIYVHDQKVGGILVEATHKHPSLAVIGIGINIRSTPDLQSQDQSIQPTALESHIPHSHSRGSINRFDVLDEIVRAIASSSNEPHHESLVSRFRRKCYLTGRLVSLQQNGHRIEGACRGMDTDGQLIIDIHGKTHRIQSGEATLVRRS